MRLIWTLFLIVIFSGVANAWDVGFNDEKLVLLTHLGDSQDTFEYKFDVCRIGDEAIERDNCIRLSTCFVSEDKLGEQIKLVEDQKLKGQFSDMLRSSFESTIKSREFIGELIKVLRKVPKEQHCMTITGIAFSSQPKI